MKATKRLVKACVTLIVSVILCVGVCFAWFAMNRKSDANGLNTQIRSTNINTFSVKAFELTGKGETDDGVVSYTIGDELTGSSVKMQEYGNIYGYETAILLRFDCTFVEETGKYYNVAAEFVKNVEGTVEKDTEGDCDLMCNLSEVLSFFETDITGTAKKGDKITLTADHTPNEDDRRVNLNNGEAYDGNHTYTFYCVIDYNETAIQGKYLYALNNIEGCSLNSQMRFDGDMIFYVAET